MQTHTAEVQEVKTAGFLKRNANKERIEQEEKELAELMASRLAPQEDEQEESVDDGPEPESAEERTFKKRYGDLRRHSQKKEQELQKQIDELKTQLSTVTKKDMEYPTTEAELEKWIKKYPDVARIFETIAIKTAKKQANEYETKFKEIDDMKSQAMREKAEAELMRLHPDFDDIRDDDDFHDWVDEQPKWIRDALYDNDTDAVSAARAIDLYKADKGIKTKKASSSKDAAKSIGARSERSAPSSDDSGKYLYESEVNKWSASEFEKRQEEVRAAQQEGRFILDMSGGAR